jgi:hypothetical protein
VRLVFALLFAACATPAKVECACSCPGGAAPTWILPSTPFPPSINGLPFPCDLSDGGNVCFIPAGAL